MGGMASALVAGAQIHGQIVREGAVVLRGLRVRVAPGERVAVMGASGSGKSTLLLALAGLADARGRSRRGSNAGRICLVPQRAELALSADTVANELALAATLAGGDMERERVVRALAAVALEPEMLERDPLSLSGGEQRRVAVAAALAALDGASGVLLLDEPSAGLDARARAALASSLETLPADIGLVIATHDADEAVRLCSRLLVVCDGTVAYDGPPAAVLSRPAAASSMGVTVPAAVALAHAAGASRGIEPPLTCDEGELLDWMACLPPVEHAPGVQREPTVPAGATGRIPVLGAGPRGMDGRVRLLTLALVVAAAFASRSLAGVGVVAAGALAGALMSGVTPRELVRTLRAFGALVVVLVAVQLAMGVRPAVVLFGAQVVHSGLAFAARRVVQIVALVVASTAATRGVSALELARSVAWLLAPLRAAGAPVDGVAFAGGVGLASAGAMTRELERIELAWRARGIEPAELGLRGRLRVRARLVVPFMVVVFRRAHALADALHARGFVPGQRRTHWRAPRIAAADLLLLGGSLALLVVGRLI
jgi:energy-coupling factor transport system ATP-binding protein